MKNYDDPPEIIPWERQSCWLWVREAVWSLRYTFIFIIGVDLIHESNAKVWWTGVSIAVLSSLLPLLFALLKWQHTWFASTPTGFIVKTGVFAKTTTMVPSERLHEVHVSQSWWLRLLNLYHVEWSVPGSTANVFALSGVSARHIQSLQTTGVESSLNSSDVPWSRIGLTLLCSRWTMSALGGVFVFALTFDEQWTEALTTWVQTHVGVDPGWMVAITILSLIGCYGVTWLTMLVRMYPQQCVFHDHEVRLRYGLLLPQRRRFPLAKIAHVSVRETWLGVRVPWLTLAISGTAGDEQEREVDLLANSPEQIDQKLHGLIARSWLSLVERPWQLAVADWHQRRLWQHIVIMGVTGTGGVTIALQGEIAIPLITAWVAGYVALCALRLSALSRAKAWVAHDSDAEYVYLRRGLLRKRWEVIPWRHIQSMSVHTTLHGESHGYMHIKLHGLHQTYPIQGVALEHVGKIKAQFEALSR